MHAAGSPSQLTNPALQAIAAAYAQAAAQGSNGVTACAAALASAIASGGDAQKATALALAAALSSGGGSASALAQAIVALIQAKQCDFVKPTLATVSLLAALIVLLYLCAAYKFLPGMSSSLH